MAMIASGEVVKKRNSVSGRLRVAKARIFAVVLFVSFITFLATPEKAEAVCTPSFVAPQIDPISVPVNDRGNLIVNTRAAMAVETVYRKECVQDGLASMAAKALLRQITDSMVNWINSGFEGGPAFVTDPEQFLADTAGEVIGEYIDGTALGFMCDPFRLDLQAAFGIRISGRRYVGCTLKDIVRNMEGFLGGDFSQGGWEGWADLTLGNNQFKGIIEAESEMSIRISGRQNIDIMKMDWGKGFLSKEKCLEWSEGPDEGTGEGSARECVRSEISTPGTVIESQLNQSIGSSLGQLNVADELDEMIGAIGSALINRAIGGLLQR